MALKSTKTTSSELVVLVDFVFPELVVLVDFVFPWGIEYPVVFLPQGQNTIGYHNLT